MDVRDRDDKIIKTKMDFIALGLKKSEPVKVTNYLKKEASNYDLKLVSKDKEVEIDEEVRSGVESFASTLDLSLLKIIKQSTQNKNTTSSDIDGELVDLFLERIEKCNLIEFLVNNKNHLPNKFYIIFAFEWYAKEPCRYKELKIDDLYDHFSNHNSWYLWYYNFERKIYHPDLDIPLILEINNS